MESKKAQVVLSMDMAGLAAAVCENSTSPKRTMLRIAAAVQTLASGSSSRIRARSRGRNVPYAANMAKANNLVKDGKLVGSGQCVAFVHAVVIIPPASLWHRGRLVDGNAGLAPGTIIATFDPDGRYGNHVNGTSHAAVYLYQTRSGIVVLDQWKGHTALSDHPPQQRLIHFRDGQGKKVDDGTRYHVVE